MSYLLYPNTPPALFEELVIVRGEGVYVYDDKGKPYIEALAGLWCTSLGYGNQELIEAATTQLETLSFYHLFCGRTHEAAMALGDYLSAIVPIRDAHIFLGNSGSDANDTHWKLLRYYFNALGKPEKRKIIAREHGYHGVSVASASLTGLPAYQQHFDLPQQALGIVRAEGMHYYRQGLPGESEEQFSTRMADNLEQLIVKENPQTVAAFIAEPVNGAGGVITPPRTYWEKIQAVLDKYEVLLIADEVVTGFGRTGNDFGSTTYEIRPDMMSLAKALTSGYIPLSASVISADLYQAIMETAGNSGGFGHGYTYSGHPVACAVALKALEIYQRDGFYERVRRLGDYLQNLLRDLRDHPLAGDIRGVGLLGAIELVADKKSRKPFVGGAVGQYAQLRIQKRGVIVRALGSVLAICPPLIVTREQLDEIVDAVRLGMDDTLDYARSQGLSRL